MKRASRATGGKHIEPIALTPRLLEAAALAGEGKCVADIGTDHAYLPCFLLREGRFERAVACDVAPGPLENAARTVRALGLADRVSLRLADGLAGLPRDEADVAVVAGMGGETIRDILDRAGLDSSDRRAFVLQPMSREEELRKYLYERGFAVERERLAEEGGRLYLLLRVRTGPPAELEPQRADLFRLALGDVLLHNPPELARRYAQKKARALSRRLAGLKQGKREAEAASLVPILERMMRVAKGI